jgi:para-nitrobenzyl esterase
LFRMPALHLADAQHTGGGSVRAYELSWSYHRDRGASHSLDFLLIFGTLDINEVRHHPRAIPGAADELAHVSRHMRSDWVRFATTGHPGWSPYAPHTRTTRIYGSTTTTGPYPEERSRRIWSTYQFDTLDLVT